MPNLPDRSLIFNNSITGAAVKPAFEDWYTVQTQMPGAMPSEELVILNGIISPNVASIIVDTEGGGATDELTNISNVVLHDGAEIRLRAKDLGRDVVVKHGTGVNSIRLIGGADKKLSTIYWLSLKNVGNIWEELVITAPISTETTAGTARIATQAEVDSGVTVGDEPAFVSVEGLRHMSEYFYALLEARVPGAGTWVAPDFYGDGKPYKAKIVLIGGGAGSQCEIANGSHAIGGEAGANGGISLISMTIIPNAPYNYYVGNGGLSQLRTDGFPPITRNATAGVSSSILGDSATGGLLSYSERLTGDSGTGNYPGTNVKISNGSNVAHLYNLGLSGSGNITVGGKIPPAIPFSKANAGYGAVGQAMGLHAAGSPYGNKAFAVSNGDGNSGMVAIYVRPRS